MQRRFLIAFTGLAWPFLILLAATGLQAPLVAHAGQQLKPIKTWSALASWYGPGFQGKTTASGQPYDMFEATAAHLWLPFGSLVRIVNSKTGRSQILRINDRGPFVDDRELDVSFLVASRLGLIGQGVGVVQLELLEEPKRP